MKRQPRMLIDIGNTKKTPKCQKGQVIRIYACKGEIVKTLIKDSTFWEEKEQMTR